VVVSFAQPSLRRLRAVRRKGPDGGTGPSRSHSSRWASVDRSAKCFRRAGWVSARAGEWSSCSTGQIRWVIGGSQQSNTCLSRILLPRSDQRQTFFRIRRFRARIWRGLPTKSPVQDGSLRRNAVTRWQLGMTTMADLPGSGAERPGITHKQESPSAVVPTRKSALTLVEANEDY
jgi:hypothetical protein